MSLKKLNRVFFYLLIILLPTQLGFHVWPDWAMVMGRRVDYLSPTLFFTDILIILILLLWSIEFWPRISVFIFHILGLKYKRISFTDIPYTIPYILFFIFVGCNIYVAENRQVAFYHWLKFLEFGLLGYYIVKTKPNLSHVSRFLFLSVFYSSLIAIGQFVSQHSLGGLLWWLGERTFTVDTPGIARSVIGGKEFLRSYATFPHPNVLGGYLATVLSFLILQYSNTQILPMNRNTILKRVTIILGIIALVLTFSRGSWIVFALGMGFLVWSKKKNIFWIPAFAGMTILLLFFVPLLWADESIVVRHELNVAAVNIIRSAPLFGVGLGNLLVALPDHIPSRSVYFLQPVHNIYLLVFAETGLAGVVIALLLVWKSISGFVYGIWDKQKNRLLPRNTIFLLPYAMLLLLGFIDHYPLTLQQGRLLLTVLVGYLLAYQNT